MSTISMAVVLCCMFVFPGGRAAHAQAPGGTPSRNLDVDAMRNKLQKQIRDDKSGKPDPTESMPANSKSATPASLQRPTSNEDQSALPDAPEPVLNDPATRQQYLATLRAYYGYRISGYEHRQRVFAWQFLSSKLIFATVLLLVCAGVYFAAIQFHKGMSGKGPAAALAVTDIEASLKGIKVSSPVLGIVILVISFAFFYLYLVYVYPIQEVF